MGTVKGLREKVHMPLYDSVNLSDQATSNALDNRMLRFFVDVQNKSKLETNMQAASTLPHYNTFELYALRVVMGAVVTTLNQGEQPETWLARYATTKFNANTGKVDETTGNEDWGIVEQAIEPTARQISDLIYGSVLTLYVGEKVMIEMPTFNFPGGGGIDGLGAANHGAPDPMAIFRFAEPVFIERQQSFRVELAFPNGAPGSLTSYNNKKAYPKVRIWVILDGYLTRDVQ